MTLNSSERLELILIVFCKLSHYKLTLVFIVHRENGADSILDLGLPEAPEKAQVKKITEYLLLVLFSMTLEILGCFCILR